MSSEPCAVKGKGDFLKFQQREQAKLKFSLVCRLQPFPPQPQTTPLLQFDLIAAAELQMYESIVV